jgi:type IV pilus assembly protein PilV
MTHRPRRQRGFTLIEILVALLIFSFGLLGFVGLQARAIQFSVGSEDSNRAALLANDLAAVMVATNTVDPANSTLATAITTWQSRASGPGGLPNASASAVMTAASRASITLQWRPTNMAASAPSNIYQTQVILP